MKIVLTFLFAFFGFCATESCFTKLKGTLKFGSDPPLLDAFLQRSSSTVVVLFATGMENTYMNRKPLIHPLVHNDWVGIFTFHAGNKHWNDEILAFAPREDSCGGSLQIEFLIDSELIPILDQIEVSVTAFTRGKKVEKTFSLDSIPVCLESLPHSKKLGITTIINDNFFERDAEDPKKRFEKQADLVELWVKYHLFQGFELLPIYLDFEGPFYDILLSKMSKYKDQVLLIQGFTGPHSNFHNQIAMNQHAILRFVKNVDWLAFCDIDEYFQPTGKFSSILEVVKYFEGKILNTNSTSKKAGIQVGHAYWTSQDGLETNNLNLLNSREREFKWLYLAKMITRPKFVKNICIHYVYGPWTTLKPDPNREVRLNHFKFFGKWARKPNNIIDDSFSTILHEALAKEY